MKQTIIGVVVFVLGFLLLTFATVFSLFFAVTMLIAGPFLKKMLQKRRDKKAQNEEKEIHSFHQTNSIHAENTHTGTIIDGDFKEITKKSSE